MKILITAAAIFMAATITAHAQAPAFPGAEGHGRYATGGRGGTVVHVTNLNDSGTGSLRSAVSSKNRIVVFDVAGEIDLQSDLVIKENITIAGQTAPYPGITLRYYTVRPGANNIIRFIRIRRGEEKDVNDGADALWQKNKTLMMLDHCSFSWSIDEVASFYDNNNFTMQWCTIGESLNNAGHDKGAHGYGGIWGGKLASFHHNMILHVNNRSPRFNGARYNWSGYTSNKLYSTYNWGNTLQAENVDFRNCVIYNTDGCYGGPGGGQINMVNNYYKSGPAATVTHVTQVTVAARGNAGNDQTYWGLCSRYFVDGNLIDGNAAGWDKFIYDNGTMTKNGDHYIPDPNHYYGNSVDYLTSGGTDYVRIRMDEPAPIGNITTHSATDAYEKVLAYAGASLYRDQVDERYAEETKTGTALYKGSVTNQYGRIDRVADQGEYILKSAQRPAGFDTDKDGMPDEWETANGLNPNSATDGKTYTLDSEKRWYTNLEVYLNSLVEDIMKAGNADAETGFDEYYPAYQTPTGIHTVTSVSAKTDDAYYDLRGLRVGTPQKGIYIRNGQKVILQ